MDLLKRPVTALRSCALPMHAQSLFMFPSPVREHSCQTPHTIATMLQIHVEQLRKGGMTACLVQDLQDAMQGTSSPSCTGQADGDNVPGPDSATTAAQTQEVCETGEKTEPLGPSCTPLQVEGKSCRMMTYGHRYAYSEQQCFISLETPRHW